MSDSGEVLEVQGSNPNHGQRVQDEVRWQNPPSAEPDRREPRINVRRVRSTATRVSSETDAAFASWGSVASCSSPGGSSPGGSWYTGTAKSVAWRSWGVSASGPLFAIQSSGDREHVRRRPGPLLNGDPDPHLHKVVGSPWGATEPARLCGGAQRSTGGSQTKAFYQSRWNPVPVAQPQVLLRRSRFLAKMVLIGTAVLLVLLVAIPFVVPHQSLPEPIVVFVSVFILIADLIAGTAAAYLFMSRMPPPSPSEPAPPPTAAARSSDASSPELEDLALRLLDGDERRIIRVLVDSRGEAFQRDLVASTAFSDAKVSRLLDRLEERGLVVRERRGMTNRVRLTLRAK